MGKDSRKGILTEQRFPNASAKREDTHRQADRTRGRTEPSTMSILREGHGGGEEFPRLHPGTFVPFLREGNAGDRMGPGIHRSVRFASSDANRTSRYRRSIYLPSFPFPRKGLEQEPRPSREDPLQGSRLSGGRNPEEDTSGGLPRIASVLRDGTKQGSTG